MELNKQKETIQNEALTAWMKAGKFGTTEIITGLGKTFLSLKALYTMPLDRNVKHLFLAEQKDRLRDFILDVTKFNKIYNCNVLQDYDIEFQCYQTVRNWSGRNFGLVIADEIPDSISPVNYNFYLNNKMNAILGLTAMFNGKIFYSTIESDSLKETFRKETVVSKEQMLNKYAPICYKYNINQGQADGTSRKLNIFIIESYLNKIDKNVIAGNAKHKFYQTESSAYKYVDSLFKKVRDSEYTDNNVDFYDWSEKREIELARLASKRATLLYNLPEKVIIVKKLLKEINEKTVIFGNSIKQLELVTPNVVASKNTDERNNTLRSMFDKNMIKTIGSFKKLVQGANLEKAGACIIMSYYSSEIGFIQKIGRLRQDGDKDGNIFILHTLETQETVWLNKMMENAIDYNIFKGDIEECILEYNKLNK